MRVGRTDLGDHHMAIKGSLAELLVGLVDVGTDHGDYRSAKGHVGYKVAVHNIDMEPVSAVADGV